MRVSADSDDENYWKDLFTDSPSIKLDGVEVEHVTEADDGALTENGLGWVKVQIFNGAYPIHANGHYLTETKYGTVTITGTARS